MKKDDILNQLIGFVISEIDMFEVEFLSEHEQTAKHPSGITLMFESSDDPNLFDEVTSSIESIEGSLSPEQDQAAMDPCEVYINGVEVSVADAFRILVAWWVSTQKKAALETTEMQALQNAKAQMDNYLKTQGA